MEGWQWKLLRRRDPFGGRKPKGRPLQLGDKHMMLVSRIPSRVIATRKMVPFKLSKVRRRERCLLRRRKACVQGTICDHRYRVFIPSQSGRLSSGRSQGRMTTWPRLNEHVKKRKFARQKNEFWQLKLGLAHLARWRSQNEGAMTSYSSTSLRGRRFISRPNPFPPCHSFAFFTRAKGILDGGCHCHWHRSIANPSARA